VWGKAKPPVFTHGPTALLFVEPHLRNPALSGRAADRGEYRQAAGAAGEAAETGRSQHLVKVKNPKAPAVRREAEEDWGK
jgi:hypothetical protein